MIVSVTNLMASIGNGAFCSTFPDFLSDFIPGEVVVGFALSESYPGYVGNG